MLDDSMEKCSINPSYTIVQPFPFNLYGVNFGQNNHELIENDIELKPGGCLHKYLDDIADASSETITSRQPYVYSSVVVVNSKS
jgi:hypothetical protein